MAQDGLTDWNSELRIGDLSDAHAHPFRLVPTVEDMDVLSNDLGLSSVKKLRFEGKLIPVGKRDWRLEGTLGATVVQPCVATLVPVTTRVETPVNRTFIAGLREDYEADSEVEMSEDDSIDPLPRTLRLSAIAEEALALAAPDYPRADGAELGVTQFTEPGTAAMTDEDTKPFAGLKALRDTLGKDDT